MEENRDYRSPQYEDDERLDPRKSSKSIRGYQTIIVILAVILAALSILYFNIHRQQQVAGRLGGIFPGHVLQALDFHFRGFGKAKGQLDFPVFPFVGEGQIERGIFAGGLGVAHGMRSFVWFSGGNSLPHTVGPKQRARPYWTRSMRTKSRFPTGYSRSSPFWRAHRCTGWGTGW